jgi:hypothetical protein
MPIVEYRDAPQNQHVLASTGTRYHLDIDTGHLFDDKGNTVAKWERRDNENTALLADYAFETASQVSCYAMSTAISPEDPSFGKERAQLMSQQYGHQLAMEDRHLLDLAVSDVHVPAALSNYAAGYRNAPPMADIVSPPLPVDKQSNVYFTYDKNDAFQRAYPATGAPSAQTYEIAPRLANATYNTIERALGGRVSVQVEANADAPLNIMRATIKRVMNAMILEREFRTQSLLRTSGNWNSAQVATILAANKWNGGPGSDPLGDIHGREEASFSPGLTGMLMSEQVYHDWVRNPAVRAYYGFKSDLPAVPDPNQFQPILKIPPIFVSKMKYINSSGNLVYVWGGDVVLFRQPDQMPPTTQDDVATSLTFRWNAQDLLSVGIKDGTASGGFIVRQFFDYTQGTLGVNRLVVVHHDAEVMTGKFAGGLLINAHQ